MPGEVWKIDPEPIVPPGSSRYSALTTTGEGRLVHALGEPRTSGRAVRRGSVEHGGRVGGGLGDLREVEPDDLEELEQLQRFLSSCSPAWVRTASRARPRAALTSPRPGRRQHWPGPRPDPGGVGGCEGARGVLRPAGHEAHLVAAALRSPSPGFWAIMRCRLLSGGEVAGPMASRAPARTRSPLASAVPVPAAPSTAMVPLDTVGGGHSSSWSMTA